MKSHGDGQFSISDFSSIGNNVVIERGALVFHPENIEIGHDVYIGHQTILKGYHKNKMIIQDGTWIGQQCFLHSAGGITIGKNVGIGPGVKMLTSAHTAHDLSRPILHTDLEMKPIVIEDDSDIGVGSILLPGITIGKGALIGAGSVVTHDIPPFTVAYGTPAKVIRERR